MKKRFISVILSAMMIMTACAPKEETTSTVASKQSEKMKIYKRQKRLKKRAHLLERLLLLELHTQLIHFFPGISLLMETGM